jgi:hypothetical protein
MKVVIGRAVEQTSAGSDGEDADVSPGGFQPLDMQSLSPRERERARIQEILTSG